jgi:hypothetical protein
MEARHARLVGRLLARLDELRVEFAARLRGHLLDAAGMDAPIGDQRLERATRHLAADRVEAGNDHGIRRVVDDHVHARDLLEGADVPALAPDDAALHLVAGKRNGRDGGLGRVLGGDALHRHADDAARLAVGGLAGLFLDVAGEGCALAAGVVLDLLQQLAPGVLHREPGDALERHLLLLDEALRLRLGIGERLVARLELLGAPRDLLLLAVELLGTALEPPGTLLEPALLACHLVTTRLHLALAGLALGDGLDARVELALGTRGLGLSHRLGADALRLGLRGGEQALAGLPLVACVDEEGAGGDDQTRHDALEEGQQQRLRHG